MIDTTPTPELFLVFFVSFTANEKNYDCSVG